MLLTHPAVQIDLQLESGEYFLKPRERVAATEAKRREAQDAVTALRRAKREEAFIAPDEGKARVNEVAKEMTEKDRERKKKRKEREGDEKAGKKVKIDAGRAALIQQATESAAVAEPAVSKAKKRRSNAT